MFMKSNGLYDCFRTFHISFLIVYICLIKINLPELHNQQED